MLHNMGGGWSVNISNMSIAFIAQTMPTCTHNVPMFIHNMPMFMQNLPSCKNNISSCMHNMPSYMHNISSCKHNMLTAWTKCQHEICTYNMPTCIHNIPTCDMQCNMPLCRHNMHGRSACALQPPDTAQRSKFMHDEPTRDFPWGLMIKESGLMMDDYFDGCFWRVFLDQYFLCTLVWVCCVSAHWPRQKSWNKANQHCQIISKATAFAIRDDI